MFACNTLCVSVPPTETSRHAVAWREVSGCHVHCKESLGEKARVLAMAVHLQMLMTCCQGTLFYPFRFHSLLPEVMYDSQYRHLLSCGKGACGFSRAVKFRPSVLRKIFLFPLRASVFVCKKPDSPKPCILICR